MSRILITASDQGDVFRVQSDFTDTATYLEMLQQAANWVTGSRAVTDLPHVAPDDILIHLDGKGDVVGVEADRADTTLTILSLLDATAFLITKEHNAK